MLDSDNVGCRGQSISYLQKNAVNSAENISVKSLYWALI